MTNDDHHTTSPPAAAPTTPRFTLGDLHERLDGVLSEGITGTVYSLRGYPGLAVKEVLLDGLDRSSLNAIRLELAALPGLSHPGILRYHQVVEDEGLIYIVTDRHDKTLERLLTEHRRRKSPVSVAVTLSIARQVTAALAYLRGVSDAGAGRPVRCDLRPANVLVSGDSEHFVIAGLGLYRDALWSGSTLLGIVAYVAPEVLLRNETSPASDMWGLGVILYELVTLRRPNFLEGREPREVFVDGWRPDLSAVADGFVKGILERILVLEPEKRLTARELCEMLTTLDVSADELGHRYVALEGRCSSLKAALNSANARIALLEDELKIKSDRIVALEEAFENRPSEANTLGQEPRIKLTRIDALEDQVKTLTDKFAQFSGGTNARDTQTGLLLLPRLIHAAHTNSTEAVRVLLEEGTRTGQRDEQGMTGLMHAARQGHLGPVKLLAEKEKGLQDRNGWTALMHAAQKGSLEVVKILLEHEKGVEDDQNHNALYYALKNGHPEAAKVIIPHEDPTDEDGVTALMRAAAKGDAGMVELLAPVQKGLKDKNGNTAFMHALRNKHRDTAVVLGRHEAPSWTPLMCASFTGDIETVRRHLSERDRKNSDGETALMLAAREGYKEIIELLDPTDEDGVTALMRAAGRGDTKTVELLILAQRGMKDKDGDTAFVYALKNKHIDTAMLLQRYETHSWTPLMCAALAGDIEVVNKHLLDKDKRNSEGDTALIIAARAGHEDIVELLDPTNEDGVTALMRAADRNDLATARALAPLQAGRRMSGDVTINGWTIYSGTALMRAAVRGHSDCVKLLLEKEGGMQNGYGWTALMWATQSSHLDCIRLLLEKERDINRIQLLNIARRNGNREIIAIL
ncbi:Kinase, NEK [Giardia lamblia P15]|uniref:Kinase, NEK n=1 Tax=Giardia intestinalis (strain P15) TaxID=658858 RepID=E1F1M1_GIAIA|nr:Kinase, NEK [Giardia lamblia P15]